MGHSQKLVVVMLLFSGSATLIAYEQQATQNEPKAFGALAKVVSLVEQKGKDEKYPPHLLADFGIRTKDELNMRRIMVRTKSGSDRYMIIIVPAARAESPSLVLVHMTYNKDGMPMAAWNYRLDSAGKLVYAAMRPAQKELEIIPEKDAMKPLANLIEFWQAYERRENAAANNGIGNAWLAKKEFDKAIESYTRSINASPTFAVAYQNRGLAWYAKGDYDKAIGDHTDAIRLDPKFVNAHIARGIAWYAKREWGKVKNDYTAALRLDPNNVAALNHLTFLYSTCVDGNYRDGKEAVALGKKLVALNDTGANRDNLAMAYAEVGDFELAVAEIRKALEDTSLNKADRAQIEKRLELFRLKKAFRAPE